MKTFGRLREEIKKSFTTIEEFAGVMGMSASTLSSKLNGKTGWTNVEMEKACKLLGIPMDRVCDYFFYA